MAIITVQDPTVDTPGPTLCDCGADTTRDRTKPGAWIAISIRAIGNCTPDDRGHMMHAVIKFAIPGTQRAGKRRRCVNAWTPDRVTINEPIEVAFDEGCGWVGTKAALFFRGGASGDQYDVTITEDVPRNECEPERVIDVYEDPFRFRLTSYFVVSDEAGYIDFPAPLPYHQWFWVVQGAAQVLIPGAASAIPLSSSYGPAGKIPLSAPRIQVSTGIYVTEGAL